MDLNLQKYTLFNIFFKISDVVKIFSVTMIVVMLGAVTFILWKLYWKIFPGKPMKLGKTNEDKNFEEIKQEGFVKFMRDKSRA